MSLRVYHKKRNFKQTTEPKGAASRKKKQKKQLYVIQKHDASHLHYDFRLELQGVLLSWAVPKGPCLDPSVKRLAMHVEDHPLEYGSFEGIIPEGQYGGGVVMLWDKGTWVCEDENPVQAYHKGSLTFELKGKKLKGLWKLIRMGKNDKTWLLFKIKDEYAQSIKKYDITEEEPDSIVSNHSLDEIAVKSSKYPTVIHPALATLVDSPPSGKNWLHEIKFDGYRLLCFKKNGKTKLITRNNLDWTSKFKNIATEINKLPIDNFVLDGEVVVLDEKQHSNFQLLQNSIKQGSKDFIYYVFDILYLDKNNLQNLSLIERKKILNQIITSEIGTLRYSNHIIGDGKEIYHKSCELGLEGIVSKKTDSTYQQRRSKDWLKIKCLKRQEFIIVGYTAPKSSRKFFGALLLASYNKRRELIFHGNVGTGFTEKTLKLVYETLLPLKTNHSPFAKPIRALKNVTWVKPKLICEVEFTDWTKEGCLRHPSFKGLKSSRNYKLTNANKILYPEDQITKEDLADYYDLVSKWMLPFIVNRPLMIVRCPEGYEKCFHQKHVKDNMPNAIHGITIQEKNEKERYIYIDDKAGLLSLIQLGALEIHPWESKIDKIENPDYIVFDIDPDPKLEWGRVVDAAHEIRDILLSYKLASFVKTTGGKGLHVVVPIKPEYDWEETKNFSQVLVNYLSMKFPKKYISKMTKSKRSGKIFIDYFRNNRGATAIAPYSTRARIHAPIATPLHWSELTSDFDDTNYTISTIQHRLKKMKKNPWEKFFKLKQSLNLDKLK